MKSIKLLLLLSIIVSSATMNLLHAGSKKNVILVLDTSMSMIGYGGKNILSDVKSSIANYVDKLDEGDRVTFITFDKDAVIYPTILIDDENDKDILKKYISMTKAKGKYTYTLKMLQKVFEKAEELKNKEKDTEVVIVIMSDGLDDPPPARRRNRLNMKKITNSYSGKDWWIYIVDLQGLKNSKKLKKYQENLYKVSKKTAILDASQDPSKGMDSIADAHESKMNPMIPIGIAVIVIIIILLVIIYVNSQANIKVTGSLEYWNNDVLDPYLSKFDLTRHHLREIVVGKGASCKLNIYELAIKSPFTISALKDEEKNIRLIVELGDGTPIEYKNKEEGLYLNDGDIFIAGNYTFKYNV